jgi:hypothetical protein
VRESSIVVAAEGGAELDGGESESVAEVVGSLGELFEFFAAIRLEEIELLAAVGERREGGAEEADFAFRIAVVTEEVEENGENIGIELRGLEKGFGARVGVEAGVANGEGESASREAGFAKALAGFLGEMTEHGFHFGEVGSVLAKSVIVGNGFGLGINEEFVGIASARFTVEGGAPLAEDFFKFFLGVRGELFDRFDAEGAQGALCDLADAGNFADRKRSEEAGLHAGGDPDKAAGLALIGSDFGGEASGGEAAGAGQAGLLRNSAEEFVCGGKRWTVEAFRAGEIEVGFIDGDHFDDGGKLDEDGGDAVAPFGIFFVMAVEEDSVRAEAASGAERHGGVDAKLAGLVAGGGDDAALIGAAADDYRLAAQFRAVEEFDGNEEGIHVHVEDGGVEGDFGGVRGRGVVLGAEAGEVWHGSRVRRWVERGNG